MTVDRLMERRTPYDDPEALIASPGTADDGDEGLLDDPLYFNGAQLPMPDQYPDARTLGDLERTALAMSALGEVEVPFWSRELAERPAPADTAPAVPHTTEPIHQQLAETLPEPKPEPTAEQAEATSWNVRMFNTGRLPEYEPADPFDRVLSDERRVSFLGAPLARTKSLHETMLTDLIHSMGGVLVRVRYGDDSGYEPFDSLEQYERWCEIDRADVPSFLEVLEPEQLATAIATAASEGNLMTALRYQKILNSVIQVLLAPRHDDFGNLKAPVPLTYSRLADGMACVAGAPEDEVSKNLDVTEQVKLDKVMNKYIREASLQHVQDLSAFLDSGRTAASEARQAHGTTVLPRGRPDGKPVIIDVAVGSGNKLAQKVHGMLLSHALPYVVKGQTVYGEPDSLVLVDADKSDTHSTKELLDMCAGRPELRVRLSITGITEESALLLPADAYAIGEIVSPVERRALSLILGYVGGDRVVAETRDSHTNDSHAKDVTKGLTYKNTKKIENGTSARSSNHTIGSSEGTAQQVELTGLVLEEHEIGEIRGDKVGIVAQGRPVGHFDTITRKYLSRLPITPRTKPFEATGTEPPARGTATVPAITARESSALNPEFENTDDLAPPPGLNLGPELHGHARWNNLRTIWSMQKGAAGAYTLKGVLYEAYKEEMWPIWRGEQYSKRTKLPFEEWIDPVNGKNFKTWRKQLEKGLL